MDKIEDIFNVTYPSQMILKNENQNDGGTNFVSSKGTNNGVSARISESAGNTKYSAGAITVAMKGSVLSTYVQPEDFYIAHQIAILYPKQEMTISEKLFYCLCIEENKYRFNYGRQADRTLRSIRVPSRADLPEWVDGSFDIVISETSDFLVKLAD
jgi:restriction endonuclease S subunit